MTTPQLTLYNTLTRSKQPFVPLDASNVRMYVCGPTVYDFAHIGNARPVIVFDVLFRLLRHVYGADHVTYVRNITDVDDKINDRAARDFPGLPLNEAIRKVTETTAAQFQADVTALGCLPPTYQPRATEFVLQRADGKADMVTLIKQLIARGHAYEAGGEVLFVDLADDVGPRELEQLVVALQVLRMVLEALAAVGRLVEPVALDHRAHRAVEDHDALGEQAGQGGGTGVGGQAHARDSTKRLSSMPRVRSR